MHITWHGHTCFKITGKSNGDEVTLALDPFTNATGLRAPKFEADIITINNNESEELASASPQQFLINHPGEYEVKKIYIEGVKAYRDKEKGKNLGYTTLYNINLEDINVVHLGYLGAELTTHQIEKLENCDILMIPVGGNGVLSAQQAMQIISQLEPSIVIPMYYNIPGLKIKCDAVDAFAKEVGINPAGGEQKLKITKKDLLADEMRTVILEHV